MEKEERTAWITYGITFVTFTTISLWGLLMPLDYDAMGYILLSFYLIMPVTSLVMAVILTGFVEEVTDLKSFA